MEIYRAILMLGKIIGLRMAGTKLVEFDDAYSGMIRDLYKDANTV